MPLFDYLCLDCGEISEILVTASEDQPQCRSCDSVKLKKMISAHSSLSAATSGPCTTGIGGSRAAASGITGSRKLGHRCAGEGWVGGNHFLEFDTITGLTLRLVIGCGYQYFTDLSAFQAQVIIEWHRYSPRGLSLLLLRSWSIEMLKNATWMVCCGLFLWFFPGLGLYFW